MTVGVGYDEDRRKESILDKRSNKGDGYDKKNTIEKIKIRRRTLG